jgi:hypothetical protein
VKHSAWADGAQVSEMMVKNKRKKRRRRRRKRMKEK